MNLYKVVFRHYAPKDSEGGIKTYILAKDDEEVFNLMSENDIGYNTPFTSEKDWSADDFENSEGGFAAYKKYVLESKGLIDDDMYTEYIDSYYGVTTFGWELVKENIDAPTAKLLTDLGIVKDLKTQGEDL